MLAGGKARGGLDVIREAVNTKDYGVRRFCGAEPRASRHTTLAKRARQAQNAGQNADAVLLLRRKLGKKTVLRPGFGSAVVADHMSKQFPIFVAPSGGNRETKKKFARGFLRRLAGLRVANATQASRSKQNPVKSRVAECGSGVRVLEGVEKSDGDAGNLRSAAHMGINGAGRGAQASQSGGFDAAIRGEAGTPDVPEAGLAESEPAIGLDAFIALLLDDFLPKFERVFGFEKVRLPDDICEDVEIVNFAEQVLEALEIVAPVGIVLGEQAFDRVAEALQPNAQGVPGFGLFRAQGLGVKLPGAFESFQRETFGGKTSNGHESGALAESAIEALPRFLVEFGRDAERILPQIRFVRFECGLQMCADGVGFGGELLYPLVHHLRIAKCAEPAE